MAGFEFNMEDYLQKGQSSGFSDFNFGSGKATSGGELDGATKWLGGTNGDTGMSSKGIIPTGLGALTGLTSAYLGFQKFNLAKQQLDQNKKVFNMNFTTQAQATNRDLEDRQRGRVAANPNAISVSEYMDKNAVSTKGL